MLVSAPFGSPVANASEFSIDSVVTRAAFEVRYLGFIPIRGVLGRCSGMLRYDASQPPGMRGQSVDVQIDVGGLSLSHFDSANHREFVKGPEFFHVARYPSIRFRSTRFRYEAERLFQIEGELELRGVVQPVTLNVQASQCLPSMGTEPAYCHAQAELAVSRRVFGMNAWSTISDTVKISIDLVARDTANRPVALPRTGQVLATHP